MRRTTNYKSKKSNFHICDVQRVKQIEVKLLSLTWICGSDALLVPDRGLLVWFNVILVFVFEPEGVISQPTVTVSM